MSPKYSNFSEVFIWKNFQLIANKKWITCETITEKNKIETRVCIQTLSEEGMILLTQADLWLIRNPGQIKLQVSPELLIFDDLIVFFSLLFFRQFVWFWKMFLNFRLNIFRLLKERKKKSETFCQQNIHSLSMIKKRI